jgi:methionine aminotransferase
VIPTKGTYFSTLKYHHYSDKGDVEFAEELTKKHGVASVPISVFFGDKRDNKVLRFCFAKTPDLIESAVEKLLTL